MTLSRIVSINNRLWFTPIRPLTKILSRFDIVPSKWIIHTGIHDIKMQVFIELFQITNNLVTYDMTDENH